MGQECKFKCWKCNRIFSKFVELNGELRLIDVCPFCSSGYIVDLAPFRKEIKTLYRGSKGKDKWVTVDTWDFADPISTTEPNK
jgi:hypothetical protein